MTQFRMWIGTLNNPDPAMVEDYIQAWHTKAEAVYATGQLEKGAAGTPHVQFFVQFKKQSGWDILRNIVVRPTLPELSITTVLMCIVTRRTLA